MKDDKDRAPTPEEIRTVLCALLLCGGKFSSLEWQAACKAVRPKSGNPCGVFYIYIFGGPRSLATADEFGCYVTEKGKRYACS